MLLTTLLAIAFFATPPSEWSGPREIPLATSSQSSPTILPKSMRGKRNQRGQWELLVSIPADPDTETLTLAGSFNHWSRTANPMVQGEDGRWSTRVSLPDGTYWYKFVADGDRWFPDPTNRDREPDGHGGANTVLRLGAEANLDPSRAARGDGKIEALALAHNPSEERYAATRSPGKFRIRLRTLANDVEAVAFVTPTDDPVPLQPVLEAGSYQWWEATLPFREHLPYTFVIEDGNIQQRLHSVFSMNDMEHLNLITPDWVRDALWYQIMVDRFRNGDPSNDPDPLRPWTSSWYESSPWEGQDGQTFYNHFVFDRLYGGDLAGLRSKLGYLRDLGVNALYLNPVFQAQGHHKYNTTNYVHIDEHYGQGADYRETADQEDLLDPATWQWSPSDRIFLDFLKEAKAQGFRVIIDGVFNHVGVWHPAFQDVLAHGQESPFADWFQITSWEPFEYEGWGGFKSLPVFRKDDDHGLASPVVREHIMNITRRWMDPDGDGDPSDGIDGWRLDVPNEVPRPFWVEWRNHVKSINPDAYITGEIWDHAGEWLDGETFDAVMNYPFAETTLAWIGNRDKRITPTEADRRLAELRMAYPEAATAVLQNLLDSHDTDRVVSKIYNPDRGFDEGNREQDDPLYDGGKPDDASYRRARLAALLQLTYLGSPMIYYGDEVGIWGSDDPNNRKPMIWDDLPPGDDPLYRIMPEQLDFYRRAIHLRQQSRALRRGDFRTVHLHDDNNTWAFLRSLDGEDVLVALNADTSEQSIDFTDLGDGWELVLTEPAEALPGAMPRVTIPPLGGCVWRRQP